MKEILASVDSGNSFTWLDITQPNAEELDRVAQEYDLHHYSVRDCLEPDHLPKFEVYNSVNFLITRVYFPKNQKNPHTIQELTSKIAVFYDDHFIITIHRQPLSFIKNISENYLNTNICRTPLEIVTNILWNTLHTYEEPALELMNRIEFYEDEIFLKNQIPNIQRTLYFLKRRAAACKKVVHLTTDVIKRSHIGMQDNPFMQDLLDLHLKLITQYDQIQEDANSILSIFIALNAQKTNEVMKILTIFSVFFMPLTFIVGIYGMNFEYIPELKQKWGYPAVLLLMALITFIIYFWFKKQKLIKK
jgi:magnesium transporter